MAKKIITTNPTHRSHRLGITVSVLYLYELQFNEFLNKEILSFALQTFWPVIFY